MLRFLFGDQSITCNRHKDPVSHGTPPIVVLSDDRGGLVAQVHCVPAPFGSTVLASQS